MRYLILSDIHANLTAFDKVLETAKGRWDKAVCLGDVVGYGPDPNEVIDRLRSLDALTIRGNHDKAVGGLLEAEDFNPVARNMVLWTRTQLTPSSLEYIRTLPQGPVQVEGFSILHGSVSDEDEYVFSPAQALEGLLDSPSPVAFFGHTHLQGGFSLRDVQVSVLQCRPDLGTPSKILTIEPNATYLLNPGSIGQPRDADPRAAFVIADISSKTIEFCRVSYDIESVQQRMTQAGLPEPLIMRLSYGR